MRLADWQDEERRLLAAIMRTASGTPSHAASPDVLLAVFNAGPAVDFTHPPGRWRCLLATDGEGDAIAADTVTLFIQEPE